jgi:integrase
VYRLASGAYQVTFRADGRQRSASFPTLRQALQFQTQTRADLSRGSWTDPAGARVKLGEWVALWEEQRRVQPTTRAKDRSRLDTWILPRFGTIPLGRIDPGMVRAWVRDMEAPDRDGRRRLARSSVQGTYALLAQIMAEAVEVDLIARSPCRGVRFDPEAPAARPARALSTAEASRLLEALREGGRHLPSQPPSTPLGAVGAATPYTLVLTALGTGLRWGELAGLRRANVHLLRRPPYLEVVESLHEAGGKLWWGPPKTSSSRRRVPLAPTVAQALAAHLPANGDPADLVFTTPQGRPWRRRNWATQRWLPAREAAGLPDLHVHDLRSTTASWLADAGVPEVIVAAFLGHKIGRSVTSGYMQVISGFEERVLAVLEERLGAAEGGVGVGG